MVARAIIASHVPPEAFEPDACRALRNLGYEVVPVGASSDPEDRPIQGDLCIVDEAKLDQIADDGSESVPVIVLTREPAPLPANRRVIASLTRPALFRDLYSTVQKAVEATPRGHPRVTTALAARCAYEAGACTGVVVSLSEGGCLFRSTEDPPGEHQTSLQFTLPRPGLISARVRRVEWRGRDLGLAFQGLASGSRVAIAQYVMERLIAD